MIQSESVVVNAKDLSKLSMEFFNTFQIHSVKNSILNIKSQDYKNTKQPTSNPTKHVKN